MERLSDVRGTFIAVREFPVVKKHFKERTRRATSEQAVVSRQDGLQIVHGSRIYHKAPDCAELRPLANFCKLASQMWRSDGLGEVRDSALLIYRSS
ncbi:hypothetical protein J6590_078547 [Homalodisca vitripennis]|nr:hypothetical protein J6590_078547 [Homalodisca vitripennis]